MGKPVSKRKVCCLLGCALAAATLAIFTANYMVARAAAGAVYADLRQVPANDVGLVLGTSPVLKNGSANGHFRARMLAAAQLYHAGKIKHLLLSGDNHIKTYDEPTEMKKALIVLGVPESALTLDYAGFRTLDSVVRARKVFGQQKLTIITDDFHVARAVFLARHAGIEAIAFSSAQIPVNQSYPSRLREYGARVLAVTDTYVTHRQPKFLGSKIAILVPADGANARLAPLS